MKKKYRAQLFNFEIIFKYLTSLSSRSRGRSRRR